ncbi:MAG TPA: hypothetical protein VGF58_17340 [Burkholderiales bacterium]|jgi:hypothetical protein
MPRPLLAAFAALALGPAALAQTTSTSPKIGSVAPGTTSASAATTSSASTQQVQLLAPQLVPFAGSSGNFDSLVNGLTTGTPVTLATVAVDGSLQIVTFTPPTALSPVDAARLLETARQNLIARGVAAPTGTQLAASLMGGTIPTLSGTSALTGVLTGTTLSPTPVVVRTGAAALQSAAGSNISPAQLLAVRNALANGTGVTLATTSGGATQNVVFAPTGVRLSDFEVNQALQLAGTLLAQQGVLSPTPDQLRAALFGGVLVLTNGTKVPLQGVLQGQVRNTSTATAGVTSASPSSSTSVSPSTNTSDSSITGTSNSTVSGTSNSTVGTSNSTVGTSNSPAFGTSNSSPATTSSSSIAGTSNSSPAAASGSSNTSTSNSSIAGTSNSPGVASPGASSSGGTAMGALAPRGRR